MIKVYIYNYHVTSLGKSFQFTRHGFYSLVADVNIQEQLWLTAYIYSKETSTAFVYIHSTFVFDVSPFAVTA